MDTHAITLYHPDTGRIAGAIWGSADQVQLNRETAQLPFVEGKYDGETYYVCDGRPTARPRMDVVVDGTTITDLPVPGTLYIGEAAYPYDEPTVELEFEFPGKYKVRVEAWPYLDKEFEVENPPH